MVWPRVLTDGKTETTRFELSDNLDETPIVTQERHRRHLEVSSDCRRTLTLCVLTLSHTHSSDRNVSLRSLRFSVRLIFHPLLPASFSLADMNVETVEYRHGVGGHCRRGRRAAVCGAVARADHGRRRRRRGARRDLCRVLHRQVALQLASYRNSALRKSCEESFAKGWKEYREIQGFQERASTSALRRAFCGRVDKALEERVVLEASSLCLFLRACGW